MITKTILKTALIILYVVTELIQANIVSVDLNQHMQILLKQIFHNNNTDATNSTATKLICS
jgi:hypothetical protein